MGRLGNWLKKKTSGKYKKPKKKQLAQRFSGGFWGKMKARRAVNRGKLRGKKLEMKKVRIHKGRADTHWAVERKRLDRPGSGPSIMKRKKAWGEKAKKEKKKNQIKRIMKQQKEIKKRTKRNKKVAKSAKKHKGVFVNSSEQFRPWYLGSKGRNRVWIKSQKKKK